LAHILSETISSKYKGQHHDLKLPPYSLEVFFNTLVRASSGLHSSSLGTSNNMSSPLLAKEDHECDAAFNQTMHGQSANQKSPLMAMLSKDSKAQQVAADAYFRHWDNKDAKIETKEDREVMHFFPFFNLSLLP
jgi:hypothetical protein